MKKQIAITFLLIVSSFTLGCFEQDMYTGPERELIGASYFARITPNEYGEYFVLIPIPLKNQTLPSDINNAGYFGLGNGTYNTIETPYGWALNISSSEEIEFSIDWISWNPVPDFSLSLNESIDNHQFYYVFSKKTGDIDQVQINITWSYQPDIESQHQILRIQSNITDDGWNLAEAIDVSHQYIV